jgi:hypothetical protein
MNARNLLVVLLAVHAQGCAGARWNARVDSARYPVSFSSVLSDANGQLLFLGEELEQVGEFRLSHTPVGFLYGSTTSDLDLSQEINGEVEAVRGEGVVNLTVSARGCGSSWLFPLNILPFYPGCQNVTISGVVVKRKPGHWQEASPARRGTP